MIGIDDAIARTGLWDGRAPVAKRISGGITNINWRIELPDTGEVFFLKIHGEGTESFINRETSNEAAVEIPKTGLAPELLFYDPEHGIEVFEFLLGYRSCEVTDTQHPVVRRNVLQAYRRIHDSVKFGYDLDGFAQIKAHHGRLKALGAQLPPDVDHLLRQVERAEAAVRASGIEMTACYNDGYISNYMIDDALNVKMIDWEYAANNDRYWDIAMFAFESHYNTPAGRRMVLEDYDGAWRPETDARLTLYGGCICVCWGMWAAYQEMTSAIPFDFGKYSDILFQRARHGMATTEWERALAAV